MNNQEIREKILNMKWSHSRLSSYDNCPEAWFVSYVEEDKGVSNGFSEQGTLVHDILESFGKGEMEQHEMMPAFVNRYDKEVITPFPRFGKSTNLAVGYKKLYGEFMYKFKGFSGDVLETEFHFEYELPNGSLYHGYIDLITETEDSINIVDYKTGNKYTKKEMLKKQRQLLLYYPAVVEMAMEKQKPIRLFFYFVKDKTKKSIVEIKYTDELIDETLTWAVDVIEELKIETDFKAALNEDNVKELGFFCNNICGHRPKCQARKKHLK